MSEKKGIMKSLNMNKEITNGTNGIILTRLAHSSYSTPTYVI